MSVQACRKSFAVGLTLGLAACGGDGGGRTSADAGRDAGTIITEHDAGVDGGEGADAGASDSGTPLEAVSIRFLAKVGESAFACGQHYGNQGSTQREVEPLDFRFYVQDVRLITAAGQEVPVRLDERPPWQTRDVALLDFENAEGQCHGNAETNLVITGKVPAGDYTGVAFKNGVPAALNHENPATVPAPLQAPGVSWGWLSGFRFFIAELAASASGAGGIGLLHLGSTACQGDPEGGGSVTCANPNRTEIRLTGFDPKTHRVVADIGAVFAHTDLSKPQLCHSSTGGGHHTPPDAGQHAVDGGHDDAGQHHGADGGTGHDADSGPHHGADGGAGHGHGGGNACAAMFPQVGLDLESGEPLSTQSVFRVE